MQTAAYFHDEILHIEAIIFMHLQMRSSHFINETINDTNVIGHMYKTLRVLSEQEKIREQKEHATLIDSLNLPYIQFEWGAVIPHLS